MANNLFLSLFPTGLAAARPTAPDLAVSTTFTSATVGVTGVFYYATDTNVLSFYTLTDGWVEASGNAGSVLTGVTAGTTQTIAGAVQLTGSYNNVTVVANAGDAVKLPAAVLGAQIWVTNSATTNSMKVFPQAATDVIDGGTAGASVNCAAAKSALFTCISSGVWQSIGSPARSA